MLLDERTKKEQNRSSAVSCRSVGENCNMICLHLAHANGGKRGLSKRVAKTARKYRVDYAVLGDGLQGTEETLLMNSGLKICNGSILHAPLYPMAVRKLAKEAGIGLMEQPVTVAGHAEAVVEFILRMKEEVKYFALAGGAEYADLITYLYDEYGIGVRLVEEAHSGICVAAGGSAERLQSTLTLNFHGNSRNAIRIEPDMGRWNEWLGNLAARSNLGVAEALLRMLGEEPKEAIMRYCGSVSLIRGKSDGL